MLDRVFPRQLSNDYQGSPLAKWVFIGVTILTIARSLIHVFAPDGGAQSIATIPLDTYSANAAATVILIFSLWGLSQLLIGLIYVVVIWRYQMWIPFMYLLMVVEYGMRIFLSLVKPIETTRTAPGEVGNYLLLPLALVMLFLSLRKTQPIALRN